MSLLPGNLPGKLSSKLGDNLKRLLSPRHIAFIGGSDADFSARQCAAQFAGPVWGVNPKRDTLGGQPCYPSIEDLPRRQTPCSWRRLVPRQPRQSEA